MSFENIDKKSSACHQVDGSTTEESDEEEQEFTCSSCCENDERTEASHYCPECDVYYCKTCLCDHAVLGRSRIAEWGETATEPDLATCKVCAGKAWNRAEEEEDEEVMCLRHPGHAVAMFCLDHEVLCCQLCCSTDHRSCSNVAALPDAAEREGVDKKVESLNSDIARLERNAKTLAEESQMRTKFAHSSYSNYAKQLDELKEKINAEIDMVKKEALDRKQFYVDKFDTDRVISENIIKELAALKNTLESTDDTEEHFVCVVQAKEMLGDKLKEIEKMLTATVTGMFEKLTVKEEGEIVDVVGSSIRSRSKMTEARFSLQTSEDEETCEIVGLCQLANGNLVLADKANNCLKQLDNNYIVIGKCDLDDKPSAMCTAGNSRVAVAMENKEVTLMSVGATFKEVRTVDVDISSRAIGQIAYLNGHIYIFDTIKCTCTSYYSCVCKTKVCVYDTLGKSVKNMAVDVRRCHISKMEHMPMAISADDEKVFVAHPCGYLASFDKQGKHITTKDYVYADDFWLGISIDDQGIVHVISHLHEPVEVVTFLQEGTSQFKRVESASFSLPEEVKPGAVCFDKNLGRVAVCPKKGDFIYLGKQTYKA